MRQLALVFVIVVINPRAATGDDWPQFRGPGGGGRSPSKGTPVVWTEKQNIVWKTPIHGKGWSSPVIAGDQVWLTTAPEDGKEFFAICVDRRTGAIVHDFKVFDVAKPAFCHPYNSYASPTPVIENGRVYVHFGTYGTACIDAKSGRVLWRQTDLHCDHFRGPGSSPIIHKNLLFVAFDGVDVQYFVALDKETGQTIWKKDRAIKYGTTNGDFKKAYGTPSLVAVNGKELLVSTAAVATIAFDPLTGDERWIVYHGGMNSAAPPQFDGKLVFLSTGDFGDRLVAVRPDGEGDITRSHIVWKSNRGAPSRTSPILIDDRLYMVSEAGVLTCLAADTGRVLWQERLGGKFCAAPVFADGKLYLFDEDGASVVGRPGAEWKRLAVNKLDAGCMATPAIFEGALYVRTKTHLYRIEDKRP